MTDEKMVCGEEESHLPQRLFLQIKAAGRTSIPASLLRELNVQEGDVLVVEIKEVMKVRR